MRVLLLCVLLGVCLLSASARPLTAEVFQKNPNDRAVYAQYLMSQINHLRSIIAHRAGLQVLDEINLTNEQCNALSQAGAQFACYVQPCYVLVECQASLNGMQGFNASTVTNTQLDGICKNGCFTRVLDAMNDFFTCSQNSGNTQANGLNITLIRRVAEFMCSQDVDGNYCLVKMSSFSRTVNNAPFNLTTAMNLTLASPMCINLNTLGCCISNILSVYRDTNAVPNNQLSAMNVTFSRCGVADTASCRAAGGSKLIVRASMRVLRLSFATYNALTDEQKNQVQLAFRRDVAAWVVARNPSLSWVTFGNVFITSVTNGAQGTTNAIVFNFYLFASTDAQTKQIGDTVTSSITTSSPTFTNVQDSPVDTTNESITSDPASSSASQFTEGSSAASVAFSMLMVVLISIFSTLFML